jgi:hypothetical protein
VIYDIQQQYANVQIKEEQEINDNRQYANHEPNSHQHDSNQNSELRDGHSGEGFTDDGSFEALWKLLGMEED